MQQSWGQAPVRLDSSALLCSSLVCWGLSFLKQQNIFAISAQPRKQSSLSAGEAKCVPEEEGKLDYIEKSIPLVLDWSVVMQMSTPGPQSFIGSTDTFLIGQNGVVLFGQ